MSDFICVRCEVGVVRWASREGTVWKHVANVHRKSCGRKPLVRERVAYEREMEAFVEDAVEAIRAM